MKTSSKRLAAVLCAPTVIGVAGCSGTTTTPVSGPSISPVVTSSTVPIDSPPSPTGSVGGIDVAISPQGAALLRPGGDPMAFTVALTNSTPADIPDVRLVVSFGHCACGYPGASIMPKGTMRMLDPNTNSWVAAPYVAEGTGMDYITQTLVPPFVLKQGQTVTYRLEARMDANPDVTPGTSRLTVTITTPSGTGHAAAVPVTVEP